MSRIHTAFEKEKAFIAFITAGDPTMDKTEEFVYEMERAGADLIELGIPFSDPIAEGVVIQDANIRALEAGASLQKVFDLVERIRKNTQVPLVFLTYMNPVHNYGYEAFFEKCKAVGLDGIIIPDLPFEEKGEIRDVAKANGIDIISLIAPTSDERARTIARDASGFIYVVSSMGVTGVRSEIRTDLPSIIKTLKEETNVPCAVGFGINTTTQAHDIAQYSDGVIVGSAIVKIVAKYGAEAGPHIYEYVKEMKEATVS